MQLAQLEPLGENCQLRSVRTPHSIGREAQSGTETERERYIYKNRIFILMITVIMQFCSEISAAVQMAQHFVPGEAHFPRHHRLVA